MESMPTAAHLAAEAGKADIIVWLASKGADVDDMDLNFKTPLRERLLCC